MRSARQFYLTVSTLVVALLAIGASANDKKIVVPMHTVDESGIQNRIGEVTITAVEDGLAFKPSLHGLSPGVHGFHVHENGDCSTSRDGVEVTPAGSAGGHLDPGEPDPHTAPWKDGHLGDLPALYVTEDGVAHHDVFKPNIGLDDVRGHALIVHAGGDNYSDEPKPLGGGGARVACGVIEQ